MKKSFSRQIIVLLAIILLFALLSLIPMFLFNRPGVDPWRMSIAMTIIQDVGIFIIPAFITARIFNNGHTLQALMLNKLPGWSHLGMMLLIYVAAMPMMNGIIAWNEGIKLPESMAGIEQWLRAQEDMALQATEVLMNINSVGQLIVVILTIGLLTGIGEELIFRGSIQRLMIEKRINIHVAIWVTAFIFSALHMQFYGFVPRMLLGAFFGYLVVCSGSLWLPILAHSLNNTIATITYNQPILEKMPWFGTFTTSTIIISTGATIILLLCYIRYMRANH